MYDTDLHIQILHIRAYVHSLQFANMESDSCEFKVLLTQLQWLLISWMELTVQLQTNNIIHLPLLLVYLQNGQSLPSSA